MATLTYSGTENAVRTLFHLRGVPLNRLLTALMSCEVTLPNFVADNFSLPTLAIFYCIYFVAACLACGLFLPR